MNPQEQELLSQLHDVVTPGNPGWWPPAIGWWVLLVTILLLCSAAYWLVKRQSEKREREIWRKTAIAKHQQLYKAFEDGEDQNILLAELSVLMRRVALVVVPRRKVAQLTDERWLETLDALGATSAYTTGVGRLLYRHQYQREVHLADTAMKELFDLTAGSIRDAGAIKSVVGRDQTEGAPVAAV